MGFYVIVEVKLKGLWKIGVFRFISKMVIQDTAIVTMEDE